VPDLADLYPRFASHWIDTSAGRIFARSGGEGPPLLLLHGYPQTNVMWHRVAEALAARFRLIIPDLPGYGWSDAPTADATHAPYTKRTMAAAMIEVMEALGHARFRLAGHDRGGRVAYRLALDHPGRLEKLAVLDIVPTWVMWHRMDARLANRAWHWMFLALPAPFPETLIGKAALFYFDQRAAAGTKSKSLAAFDPRSRTTTPSSTIPCASMPPARTIAPAAPPTSPTTRRRAPPARRSPARCWRSGAPPAASRPRPRARSRPGANGRATCAAFRSTAGTISPRRRRRRRHTR